MFFYIDVFYAEPIGEDYFGFASYYLAFLGENCSLVYMSGYLDEKDIYCIGQYQKL